MILRMWNILQHANVPHIVDLNTVPLMVQPLCIHLHPIIVLALLQYVSVERSDVDDVAAKEEVNKQATKVSNQSEL